MFDVVKMIRRLLLTLVLTLSLSIQAHAHPHAWIDMETALIFDDQGRVTGLRVGWLFDDFYSAFSLDGIEATQQKLNELAEINLGNLKEYKYFTDIKIDGVRQKHGDVSEYNTELIGNRLWLDFVVPLLEPVDPMTHEIVYSVYDPTYYVEILHATEGDPIRFEGAANAACGYAMKNPEPPEDIALLAAALDKTETAGDAIGTYFAERVVLSCR